MYEQGGGWPFGPYVPASNHQILPQFNAPPAGIDRISPTASPQGNPSIMTSPQEIRQNLGSGIPMPAPLDRWLTQPGREQGGEYLPAANRFNGSLPENVGYNKSYREPVKSDNSSIATGNKESRDSGYETRCTALSTTSEEPNRAGVEISGLEAGLGEIKVRTCRQPPSQSAASEKGEKGEKGGGRAASKNKPNEEICQYCGEKPRLASELKKHLLKHERPYTCDVPDCEKGKPGNGFTTVNDLERHRGSKHNVFPPSAKIYKCAAPSCAGKSKKWPRLDNFRQHVDRTHPNENKEELVKRSQCEPPPPNIPQPVQEENMETNSHTFGQISFQPIDSSFQHSDGNSNTIHWPAIHQNASLWSSETPANTHFAYPGQTSVQQDFSLLTPQPPSSIQRPSQPGPQLELKHYRPKSDQPTRERSSSRASSRISGLNNRASSTSNGRSRSTSGKSEVVIHNVESPPSQVVIHNNESDPLISQIAKIFGKEEDEDAKRKVSMLLGQSNTDLFHRLPSNKRRALDRTDMIGLQPGPGSKVMSSDELHGYRQRNSHPPNLSPKSESSSSDVSFLIPETGFECREANCHAQLTNKDELSRHMQEQHQTMVASSPDLSSVVDVSMPPAGYKCPRPSCSSRGPYQTKTSWDKHVQRHERRFGCTFDSCHKKFGSKNDWKRHENSQHFQVDIWKCDQPAKGGETNGQVCHKLFYRKEVFASHLRKTHAVQDRSKIDRLCKARRIGVNGQSSFWCGFCKEIKPLASKELSAWDERFDHIGNHFTKDHFEIENWVTAGGKKTKRQVREEMQREFKPPVEVEDESSCDEDEGPIRPRPPPRSIDNACCVDPYLLDFSQTEEEAHRPGMSPMDISESRIFNFYCCACGDGPYPMGGSEVRCNGNGNANSTSACSHIFCQSCRQ